MKSRIYLLVLATTFSFSCFGQAVKSKDGVTLGQRSEFISSCIKGAKKEMININGLEIETSKYCACVCDNLIPAVNSWEINKAVKENKMTEFLLKDNNFRVLLNCLEGNYEFKDDFVFNYAKNSNLDLIKKIGINNCINAILNDKERKDNITKEMAEKYCDCALTKLIASNNYKYKDLVQIKDENSPAFNEIALPCFSELLKKDSSIESLNKYNVRDIEGGGYYSIVPLIDYYNLGYKVKINLSGISKYFLFDTGASDLIIDRDTERELLLNGALKRENYLNKIEYTLANNQTVMGQKVKVNNIVIGDYTLNNVVIAIIDDGQLLCGKSILDKFKSWDIDKATKTLILYK